MDLYYLYCFLNRSKGLDFFPISSLPQVKTFVCVCAQSCSLKLKNQVGNFPKLFETGLDTVKTPFETGFKIVQKMARSLESQLQVYSDKQQFRLQSPQLQDFIPVAGTNFYSSGTASTLVNNQCCMVAAKPSLRKRLGKYFLSTTLKKPSSMFKSFLLWKKIHSVEWCLIVQALACLLQGIFY